MKLLVVYRSNSDHGRKTEDFIYEYKRRYPGTRVDVVGIDTREGSATASIYDITSYPAILALQDNGAVSMVWQGDSLPLIDEVAGYALN